MAFYDIINIGGKGLFDALFFPGNRGKPQREPREIHGSAIVPMAVAGAAEDIAPEIARHFCGPARRSYVFFSGTTANDTECVIDTGNETGAERRRIREKQVRSFPSGTKNGQYQAGNPETGKGRTVRTEPEKSGGSGQDGR